MIDPADVYNNEENEYGIEIEPHITIMYGFKSNINHEHIMPYLMPSHFIKVEFKDISMFEADEYDVLKFGCESKALDSLHKATKHYFENTWQWPDYNPHATIAYLKKGTAKKYVRKLSKPFTLVPSGYLYSYPSGEKFEFDGPELMPGYTDNIVIK